MSLDGKPLVSVVMTVYNGEKFLKQAINSVLEQAYDCFELVVVDDASTDSSASILESYSDPRMIVIHVPENIGPYRAANEGLKRIRGEFVARHDADDTSHRDRFLKQVNFLNEHPNVGLVHSDYQFIDSHDRIIANMTLPKSNDELQKMLEKRNIFAHPAIMVRTATLTAVGGYREFFPVAQDYDLYLRIGEIAELANIPEYLFRVRIHNTSISRNKRVLQLACKDLAWSLAQKRRAGLPEGPIPEHVIEAFPPDPEKLFLDARGMSYLYYASDQPELATEGVQRALEWKTASLSDVDAWEKWALDKAHRLADLRRDTASGEAFLSWLDGNLRQGGVNMALSKLIGHYYTDRAFMAHHAGSNSDVRQLARTAFMRNPAQMRNAGLWKIFLESLR